ncbi:MAG TPA: NAD(P)-binding domain-containing protein, partial [Alphaproteobacteria bacterium]|nr:NAD(P)-binding domain-containing protein [Alphaproteobacteria bacterium]
MDRSLPVIVIGAGPVGLAAAAHLLARDLAPLVLEAGPAVASSIRGWGHVRLFSPWRFDIDAACAALLRGAGWTAPDADALPTGAELVSRYLEPLAALPVLRDRIRLNHRVTHISRRGFDKVKTEGREAAPFLLRVATPEGEREFEARAVIDASGTWTQPNPAGGSGLPALGEAEASGRIAYGIPDVLGADRATYAGATVLVVG